MDDPTQNPENYKWNTFYFNRNDPRVFVQKRLPMMGFGLNFARSESYAVIIIMICLIILINTLNHN